MPAAKTTIIAMMGIPHRMCGVIGRPAMTCTIAYTTSVGRKSMKHVRTDESGSSVRGKAVFRISRPPPTTERAPWLMDVLTSRNVNRARRR